MRPRKQDCALGRALDVYSDVKRMWVEMSTRDIFKKSRSGACDRSSLPMRHALDSPHALHFTLPPRLALHLSTLKNVHYTHSPLPTRHALQLPQALALHDSSSSLTQCCSNLHESMLTLSPGLNSCALPEHGTILHNP